MMWWSGEWGWEPANVGRWLPDPGGRLRLALITGLPA